jgi:uncharacterized membrane protein YfcA
MDTISGMLLIFLLIIFVLITARPKSAEQKKPASAPAAKPATPAVPASSATPQSKAPPLPRRPGSIKPINDFIIAVISGVVGGFVLQLFARIGNSETTVVAQSSTTGGTFWIASVTIFIIVFALLSRNAR